MHKILIRSEKEFGRWLAGMRNDRICVANEEAYPPEKYPCLIAYFLKDIDSMSYAEDCYADYIYLSDFDGWMVNPEHPGPSIGKNVLLNEDEFSW